MLVFLCVGALVFAGVYWYWCFGMLEYWCLLVCVGFGSWVLVEIDSHYCVLIFVDR